MASLPSWLTLRRNDELALDQGCWFDLRAADRVRQFFYRFLRHSKGEFAGKPFELFGWQWEDVIAPAYGWRRADGTRRFRRIFVFIPKKNGKSTLCSGISIYSGMVDEPGAEVYSVAKDRSQASIVYNEAANMVHASPELENYIEVVDSAKLMKFHASHGIYKALSADVPTKEGLNISCLLFDELHTQTSRTMWDTLRFGGRSRRQPMYWSITTAGFNKRTICGEQYDYAKRVRDGLVTDTAFLPYIAEAEVADDWTLESTWRKANPSFGLSVKADAIREECASAMENPSELNSFLRYTLNLWTSQETKWIAPGKWAVCKEDVDYDDLRGELCYGGLDLASTTDIAALVLFFPARGLLLPFFWCPRSAVDERQASQRVQYDEWVRRGWLVATEGNVIDYSFILEAIRGLAETYSVALIAYDRWNADQLVQQITDECDVPVMQIGQGYASMAAPTREFERLVNGGMLRHPGNPVFDWMVDNAAVDMDAAGNKKPSRKRSGEKIDGVMASMDAIGAWLFHEEEGGSVYEKEGV